MKRTTIICIAVLLLTAAGSLIIYKNHLQIEADMVAGFNESRLTLARLTGRGAEMAVDGIRRGMVIASWMPSIIKGNERCLSDMKMFYGDLKEENINLLFRLDDRGISTHCLPEDRLKGVTGKDFSFREYFKEVKRTGRPYISGTLLAGGEEYGEVEGRFRTIFIVVPLYDNGKFAGVLGTSLDLASMLEKSLSVRMMGTREMEYYWAIDDRGIFVAHPIREFIGRNAFAARKERAPDDISFEEIDRIMREKMMKGKEGVDTYISGWHGGQKGKIRKLIAYAPFYLDGRQYSAALATPEREVILLSRKNLLNTLLTMAIIAVTGLFGLLYILNLDRQRIKALEREAGLAKEVKESRNYLRNLLESANDLIYTVDINGNFTYLNSRVEDYGYTPDELLGKHFLIVLTEKHRGKRFEKSIREKVRQSHNVEVTTKEGAIRICRISTSPLMDQEGAVIGLIATVRDITEREQARAEITHLKEYSEKIVASIPSSLLVLDKELNIKSVNRMYRETRGITDNDVAGKNIKEVLPGHLLKEGGLLQAFDEVVETRETRRLYGVKHVSSDHQENILNITVSGIRRAEEEEEEDIIMIIEDVTERARLAEEIRKKNKDMENFVYTISHDLRAPIVSVQGFSSILLSDFQNKLDDTGKRYLARIQANVRQMEILIDDLLEFSRIGRAAGAFEDVPSVEIIKDVMDVLGPQLKKRGIVVNVQGNLPVIYCERSRIFQVFENLIQNGIKYMGDTESPVIEIGCKEADGFHEFYVKDNGIGIDPKYHQRIFQIFQRLKEVDAKGTGIGLAIVERITGIHGGSVRVESERGKGATFYFSVPEKGPGVGDP